MSSATEAGALVATPEQQLMPPPAPRPKRKREEVVLEEDEWLEAIEAIVRRDYFPDLPKLESELEWLEAVRSKDPVLIRQAQANITARRAGLRTPAGRTPATFATPATVAARTPGLGATPGPGATPGQAVLGEQAAEAGGAAPKMSLDAFMARHTSEDNASFKEILAGINRRRRERYAWAHRAQPQQEEPKRLEDARPLDGFGTSGQPDGALLMLQEPPANSLYYGRDSVPLTERELAMQVQGPPKGISTSATRLPGGGEEADADAAPPAKRVRGDEYDRVATPALTPGPEAPPPMTWGSLGATPARIVEEDSGPRFHVPQRTAKDQLARRLADGAKLNLAKRAALLTPAALRSLQRHTPKAPGGRTPRVAMSPAAHRLASSLRGKGGLSAADSLLRASYSGSAARRQRPGTGATPALAAGPADTPAILRTEEEPPAGPQAFEPDVARGQALRAFEQTAARREALRAFGKITDGLMD